MILIKHFEDCHMKKQFNHQVFNMKIRNRLLILSRKSDQQLVFSNMEHQTNVNANDFKFYTLNFHFSSLTTST